MQVNKGQKAATTQVREININSKATTKYDN
jgi:hypothetical protein